LYIKTYVHLRHLAELLLKKEMFQTRVTDGIGTNILCSMPSEQESGWTLEEPVWTLWTGNKENISKIVFLHIPPEAIELWSKQERKHMPH